MSGRSDSHDQDTGDRDAIPAETSPSPGAGTEADPGTARDWGARIVLVLVTVVLLALAAVLAVTFVPRWWAHRVADVGDGTFTTSIFAGFVCGFVFTALPLLALRRVFGRRGGVTARVVWLLVTALLAAPNLTTLAIVVGEGSAAHAAERTLDVGAPGFRYATVVGAMAAAVFVIMLWFMLGSRRHRTRQLRERDAELSELRDRVRRDEKDPGGSRGGDAPAADGPSRSQEGDRAR